MGKAKREDKRARRAARGTVDEQLYVDRDRKVQRRTRKRMWTVGLIPAAAIVIAAVFYRLLDDPRAAGVALLMGTVIWFLYGLGMLGASIPPRSRTRGAPVNFGRKS
jgi:hypothetical protein